MPTRSGADDDTQWRRPADGTPTAGVPTPAAAPVAPPYTPPPPTIAPPRGWKPRVLVRPAPPRELPAQDAAQLDAEDQSARTLTYGVAMVAGAIAVLLLLLLCARVLF